LKWTTLQPGFGIVHRSVLTSKTLSRGAKLLYSLLCSYANQDGECFPSQVTMAEDLGATDTSIQTWIDELTDAWMVEKRLEGMPAHNVYTVLYPTRESQLPSVVGNKIPTVVPVKLPSVVGRKNTNEEGGGAAASSGSPQSRKAGHEASTSVEYPCPKCGKDQRYYISARYYKCGDCDHDYNMTVRAYFESIGKSPYKPKGATDGNQQATDPRPLPVSVQR
jgi:ribosomal protein L37AE/L43A